MEGDRKLKTYSETYLSRKMKLRGYVFRAGNEDPMRPVSFKSGCVKELEVGTRRVGKPKLDWIRQDSLTNSPKAPTIPQHSKGREPANKGRVDKANRQSGAKLV